VTVSDCANTWKATLTGLVKDVGTSHPTSNIRGITEVSTSHQVPPGATGCQAVLVFGVEIAAIATEAAMLDLVHLSAEVKSSKSSKSFNLLVFPSKNMFLSFFHINLIIS